MHREDARRRCAAVVGGLLLLAAGCASGPPHGRGVAGVSPSPAQPWTPPSAGAVPAREPGTALPAAEVQQRLAHLTLAEVVDLALQNSPDTRAAWADARAAAAQYGAARGAWLPSLGVDATLSRAKGGAAPGATGAGSWATTYGPTLDLTWLLFDLGGRAGRVEAARQTLLAADWTHNAAIADRILQAEVAFYTYAGARAILEADSASVAEADSSLAAAQERHDVGLATIADVLQARTARAQARLDLEDTEGQVRTTKGALAVAMGYPAHVPFDVHIEAPDIPTNAVTQSVESLIDRAVADRPDLQAARARAMAAAARVREAASEQLPALSLSAATGRSWRDGHADDRGSAALLLHVPLFTGFAAQQDLAGARATAEAAGQRARGLAQQVIYEVFAAHSDLLTATQRVQTADELLASATQSQEVALGRYREGAGDILDLLSAQRALAAARAQRIGARLGWFTALARLAHEAGALGLHGENPLAPRNLHPEVER